MPSEGVTSSHIFKRVQLEPISNSDGKTYHWPNVGRGLGKNARPPIEIRFLVALDRRLPCLIEVVEHNVGVRKDQICVEMVDQVVADREVDPLFLRRESFAVFGTGNYLELVRWANSAYDSR